MAQQADVLVIGGGVVGLSVANALLTRGRSVTILERKCPGAGASWGNAGLVAPRYIIPLAAPGVVAQGLWWMLDRESPFRIKPRLDLDLLRWLWSFWSHCSEDHVERSIPLLRDLNLASRNHYETWAASNEMEDFGFRASGSVVIHRTEKGRQKNLKQAQRAQEAGLDVSVLERSELDEVLPNGPSEALGGIHYHQDALLNPVQLVSALEHRVSEKGGSLRPGTAVTDFEQQDGRIHTVRTPRTEWNANEVILAAGAWSASLAQRVGIDLPIQPAKGYSVTYSAPSKTPDLPYILSETKVAVTPMNGQVRCAGTLELAGFEGSVDARRTKPILEEAARYVPHVRPDAPEQENVWAGFRPCTPDGLPVIGRVPKIDNLVIATGHGMMGVSMSPITGQLVAEIVENESPSIDWSPLSPTRFSE
jgi:D-amino-acid dehydrogenase